jgi:glycosyltransferase involved in cell wall biosynthesis
MQENEKRNKTLRPILFDPLPGRPLVSILLSNYNYAPYLVEAINSCLDQTYTNFELIVCDDGSTDCSHSLISSYRVRDRRIKPIFQRNGGQAAALNAAFHASAGEVICLLDADDVFLPAKLQRIVDAFIANPDSGFAINKMLRVDKERKPLGEIPLLYQLPSGWLGDSLDLSGPQVLAGLPPTSGLSLRRSVANIIFPLPASLRAYADRLIQVVAPLMTPVVAIQARLSEYRVHGGNVGGVTQFTERHIGDLLAYDQEIWRAWRRYLTSPYSGLPPDFPLPSTKCPSLMDYAYARFRHDRNFRAAYSAIPRACLQALSRFHRWYWRTSLLLPSWIFRMSFHFVYGQTRTKMILGRILTACGIGAQLRGGDVNSQQGRYQCGAKAV